MLSVDTLGMVMIVLFSVGDLIVCFLLTRSAQESVISLLGATARQEKIFAKYNYYLINWSFQTPPN